MIDLYTRPSCPRCVEIKKALSDNGITFTERVLDSDIPTAEVRSKFPDVTHLPILAVGKHVLGGVEELRTLIEHDHLKHLYPS